VVVRVQARQFEEVAPGQPVYEVGSRDALEVEVLVPEQLVPGLAYGAPVAVTVPGLDDRLVTGRVIEIGSAADAGNAFRVRARLDEVQRSLAVASAQRDAARAQAQANRADGPEQAALEAQRQAAEAAVQAAVARLAQATLRAPAASQVIARSVEPGQIVQPGRVLLTLAVDGPTELLAQVDERFLGQLRVGQRARVLADAYPQQPFDAVLTRVAPGVDAASGSVEVVFTPVGTVPAFLREDMTLSVEAVTGERDQALVLPLLALRTGAAELPGSQARVLVLVDGHAQERVVTLGLRTLDQAEVTAGLQAGDTLLLSPQLAAGSRVRLRAAP
jgi:HlyD family secretion protein